MWDHFITQSAAENVFFVAHSYGGLAFVELVRTHLTLLLIPYLHIIFNVYIIAYSHTFYDIYASCFMCPAMKHMLSVKGLKFQETFWKFEKILIIFN